MFMHWFLVEADRAIFIGKYFPGKIEKDSAIALFCTIGPNLLSNLLSDCIVARRIPD
jgi:hypothetical protein